MKSLNTINCKLMVDPASVPGDHVVFVCGDDEEAKEQARAACSGSWDGPQTA